MICRAAARHISSFVRGTTRRQWRRAAATFGLGIVGAGAAGEGLCRRRLLRRNLRLLLLGRIGCSLSLAELGARSAESREMAARREDSFGLVQLAKKKKKKKNREK